MKRQKRVGAAALLLALCIMLASCVSAAPTEEHTPKGYASKSKQTGDYFGTASILCLYGDFEDIEAQAAFEQTWSEVKEILEQVEAAVAVDRPDSDVARFNELEFGESTPVGTHTAQILSTARQVWMDTDGAYDPTVYPLVDLWAFTPRFNTNMYTPTMPYDRAREDGGIPLPEESYIQAFRDLVDFGGVVLSGNEEEGYTLEKNIPPVTVDGEVYQAKLDLGGIAKGYAVDLVMELLKEEGWEYGYFSCGSSSIGMMKNGSAKAQEEGTAAFSLGIRKPRATEEEGTAYAAIAVQDACISSSGDYEHSYIQDGVLYCHMIDPETGWPMNTPAEDGVQSGLSTVTLIGGTAAYNDAMTTALCIMGTERAEAYCEERLKEYQRMFVTYEAGSEQYGVWTNIPEEQYWIQDPAYIPQKQADSTDT